MFNLDFLKKRNRKQKEMIFDEIESSKSDLGVIPTLLSAKGSYVLFGRKEDFIDIIKKMEIDNGYNCQIIDYNSDTEPFTNVKSYNPFYYIREGEYQEGDVDDLVNIFFAAYSSAYQVNYRQDPLDPFLLDCSKLLLKCLCLNAVEEKGKKATFNYVFSLLQYLIGFEIKDYDYEESFDKIYINDLSKSSFYYNKFLHNSWNNKYLTYDIVLDALNECLPMPLKDKYFSDDLNIKNFIEGKNLLFFNVDPFSLWYHWLVYLAFSQFSTLMSLELKSKKDRISFLINEPIFIRGNSNNFFKQICITPKIRYKLSLQTIDQGKDILEDNFELMTDLDRFNNIFCF